MVILRILLLCLVSFSLFFIGCGKAPKNKERDKSEQRLQDAEPIENFDLYRNYSRIKVTGNLAKHSLSTHAGIDSDSMWALGQSVDGLSKQGEVMKAITELPGVVPLYLVPGIREALYESDKIKKILDLPEQWRKLLKDIYLDEQTFRDEILGELKPALAASTPGAADFSTWPNFDFYLFPQFGEHKSFNIMDQVSKWSLIFGSQQLWEGSGFAYGESHLTQSVLAVSAFSEVEYLFGLGKNSLHGFSYGGLAINLESKSGLELEVYDPRLDDSWAGVFSGSYSVDYDESLEAWDLAMSARPYWSAQVDGIRLNEQALMWIMAAQIFETTRPSARENTSSLYKSGGGLLPDDVHLLGLAFLPSLEFLLSEYFIDADEKIIFDRIDLSSQFVASGRADMLTISRLVRALLSWAHIAESINGDDGLDSSATDRLKKGKETMMQASRLGIQKIITEYFTRDGSMLIPKDASGTPLAVYAETLFVLMETNISFLKSHFLREQIIMAVSWFVEKHLPATLASERYQGSVADYIWINNFFKRLGDFSPQVRSEEWYVEILQLLDGVLKNAN